MKLTIEVQGVPPKKDGASSMWKKPTEVQRIRSLRLAMAVALAGKIAPSGPCRLDLEVRAVRSEGDLDNFVTGVCDGLQPVHPNTPLEARDWADLPEAARPDRALALKDDALVDEIRARRVSPRAGESSGYRLTVDWPEA